MAWTGYRAEDGDFEIFPSFFLDKTIVVFRFTLMKCVGVHFVVHLMLPSHANHVC